MVKLNSKSETVELTPEGVYLVRVRVPPVEGRANDRIVELLAKHLGLPKSRIELLSGHRSKRKTFAIR